jgi:hypothetical protein
VDQCWPGLSQRVDQEPACRTLQKWYILAMAWSVEFLNKDVKAELDVLPEDIRASFERIVHLIEMAGLHNVHEPYVKRLEGPLGRCACGARTASPVQLM